ncbi:hypothetical protein LEMLEM_LOCUS1066 [Lemmus lemmus]
MIPVNFREVPALTSMMTCDMEVTFFIRRWMERETEPTLEHWTELPGSR